MTSRSSPRARLRLCAVLAATTTLAVGCSSGSCPRPVDPARDVYALSPGVRSRALALDAALPPSTASPVGARGERIAAWIERLDDEDLTVRMQAYARLREATGHDTGYRPFLERGERARHVDAWWAWWRGETTQPIVAGEVAAPPEPTAPTVDTDPPTGPSVEVDAPDLELPESDVPMTDEEGA